MFDIKELMMVANNACKNSQDAALYVLTNLGIKNEEIRNLQIQDCDFTNNEIALYQGENSRVVALPNEVMNLIKEAYEQEHYVTMVDESNNEEYNLIELKESNYIIKNGNDSEKSSSQLIKTRLKLINECIGV